MIKKLLTSDKFLISSLFLFCLLLIAIWFKDGKLLATGEEGLLLFNPTRNIELYKYSWNEIGFGGAGPGSNVMIPFYHFEAFILNTGLTIWLFQALIFLLLMFIGSCSIYFLTKELLNDKVNENLKVIALISALFYILNPISLLGVWYRFLLGFMFFYALAPLFFYLYFVGINNKKISFIIIIPLITLLFSFAFANPASVLTLWLLPIIYSICLSWHQFSKGQGKLKIYPLIYFSLMLIFWILINFWWIFPYIELSKIAFASETSPVHAIGTLTSNSKDFTIPNVIRLIHAGVLYRAEAFGEIYKTPFFQVLSWLIPFFTICGLFKLKSSQIKVFLTTSLITLLFLVKGTSPPLGGIFLWFFINIPFLGVYRNPLEKIGLLLPIIYAPIFSFGMFYFAHKIQNFKKRVFFLLLIPVLLMLLNWPFFSGALTRFEKRDIRVEVPSSFKSADKAIPQGNHVILSLPVMGGASGLYKWQYGYKGVENSQYLFSYPVINIFYDATSFTGQLLIAISSGKLHNLTGLAQLFSADIVAYRKDTDVLAFGYNLDALEQSEKMINKANLIKFFDSQEVSLWALPQQQLVPLIYTPKSVKFGESANELISLLENNQFDLKSEVFICNNKDKCNPSLSSEDLSKIQIQDIPEKTEFNKISPVNYNIRVNNSKGKFLLVFNQSYHPGWTALVEGQPIDKNRHIVANGYSNGFLIEKVGSFNIELKFAPEEEIANSYKVSLMVILSGVIILFGSWIFSLFKHD